MAGAAGSGASRGLRATSTRWSTRARRRARACPIRTRSSSGFASRRPRWRASHRAARRPSFCGTSWSPSAAACGQPSTARAGCLRDADRRRAVRARRRRCSCSATSSRGFAPSRAPCRGTRGCTRGTSSSCRGWRARRRRARRRDLRQYGRARRRGDCACAGLDGTPGFSRNRRAASMAAPRFRPLSFACLISITVSSASMS